MYTNCALCVNNVHTRKHRRTRMLIVHVISSYGKPQLDTMISVAEELQLKYDIVTGFSKEESYIGAEIAGEKDFLPIPIKGKKIILAVMKDLKKAKDSGVDKIADISAIFEKWLERYEKHNAKSAPVAPEKAPLVQTPREDPKGSKKAPVAPVNAPVEELSVINYIDINNTLDNSSKELDALTKALSKENFYYKEREAFELEDSLYLSARVGNKYVFSNINFYKYDIAIIEKVVSELGAFLRSKDAIELEEIEKFFSKQNKEVARSVNK